MRHLIAAILAAFALFACSHAKVYYADGECEKIDKGQICPKR